MRKRLNKLLNPDDVASRRTFYHSMELLAVAAVALAIGFFAAEFLRAPPQTMKTDANEQRPPGTVVAPDKSPPLRPSGEVDPVLKKPEKGTDQHG